MAYRTLVPGQRAEIWVGGPEVDQSKLLFETDEDAHSKAPNCLLTARLCSSTGMAVSGVSMSVRRSGD